ncbi:MAG: hypothetical protein M3135_01365 [Actinomycetota bacterium]|nr:hypothetical protein [Actinomycetota bacterium]
MSARPEELRCVVCGDQLVRSISEQHVVTPSGHHVLFRRHTDYVVCPGSQTLYRVTDLRQGFLRPLTDAELAEEARAQLKSLDQERRT